MNAERLLDDMRYALTEAATCERLGLHEWANAWAHVAASKLEQAIALDERTLLPLR